MLSGENIMPVWQHYLAFVLAPAFGALGGWLRQLYPGGVRTRDDVLVTL